MSVAVKRLPVFSFCVSLVSALAFDAPLPTPVCKGFQLEPQGWSPKPTEAPSLDELRKRQNIQNLILASDANCGYISAISASPFGLCCDTCTCGFQTTPGIYGNFYCCNTATCESRLATSCIDNNQFSFSNACNDQCVSDPATLKCTASPYVYCNLAQFEGVTVQALFCDTVTVSHTQLIYTTYSGETNVVFTTFTGFPSSTSSSSSSSPSSSTPSSSFTSSKPSSGSISSKSSSSSTSSSPTTLAIETQTVTSAATATSSSSPAPIGAIVGGSVGGAAVIAVVVVLIFFLFRRKGKKNDAPHVPVGPTHYTPLKPETQYPEKFTPVEQETSTYNSAPQGSVVQQYPQQSYGGYYPVPQQSPQPQPGAYQQQQPQYAPSDNRFSQQQYQQPYDPSQVGAQYNHHIPPVPETAELQSVTQNPTSGRHEVPG